MPDAKQELQRIHAALVDADTKLAEALDARARAAGDLVKLREQSPDLLVNLPREHEVIAQQVERVEVFPKGAIGAVMTEVLSACTAISAPLEVVYSGQEGGFGHLAARRHFGSSAVLRAVETAEDVLSEIERGRASFGMLPFETSHDGAVTGTVNLLARGEAKICAEVPVARRFNLVSKSGRRGDITKVYASSSATAACGDYLDRRLPDAVIIDTRNGVVAAEHAQREDDAAALVTDMVLELSRLEVVERAIEDASDLETRYVVVGNDFPARTGRDRTAVVLALHDAPGVLIDCLRPFADRKINLYRLETRPARGWEFPYLILFEIDGHMTDRPVIAAIEELRGSSRYVKVLGSYPRVTEL